MANSIQSDFNVAINFDESSNSVHDYEEMCGSSNELRSFIKNIASEDILKKIIQQFLRAAEYVHDKRGIPENIKMENIFVAESRILIQSTAVFGPEKANVISSVYKICGSIFRAASKVTISDSETADHWIRSMKEEPPIENILKHPYFWDDKKKLAYICNVAQFVKISKNEEKEAKAEAEDATAKAEEAKADAESKAEDAKEKARNNTILLRIKVRDALDSQKNLEIYHNWNVTLRIKILKERDDYDKESPISITETTIQDLTLKSTKKKPAFASYKETLSSLLNFIRNHHEHFWGQSTDVRACFLHDRTYGYWKFFNAHRFKNLFYDVYVVASSFKDNRLFDIVMPAS